MNLKHEICNAKDVLSFDVSLNSNGIGAVASLSVDYGQCVRSAIVDHKVLKPSRRVYHLKVTDWFHCPNGRVDDKIRPGVAFFNSWSNMLFSDPNVVGQGSRLLKFGNAVFYFNCEC